MKNSVFTAIFGLLMIFSAHLRAGGPSELSIGNFTNTSLQIHNPVKWEFTVKKINDNQRELVVEAKIERGWNLYSQHLPSDDGPVATAFDFKKSPK
jgi:hypothetical protein